MNEPLAIPVVDLSFGDCGKGTIVDYLTRTRAAHTVVRFNGGPQAGHNVVTPDGRHHTFSQFGSGSFVPGVRTLLSRFMLIEPYAMANEAAHLIELGVEGVWQNLFIDARCPVITPCHQVANRLRELARGPSAHGTCGMGVGELMQDMLDQPRSVLCAGELSDRSTVLRKLKASFHQKREELRDIIRSFATHPSAKLSVETLLDDTWIDTAARTYAEVARRASVVSPEQATQILCTIGTILFEGAQGVLLDESFGFHPHTTWSNTTYANADTLLDEAGHTGQRLRIGVLRSYFTRHGNGPLVSEDRALAESLPEPHNDDAGWQGRFRAGVFDLVATRYAIEVAGPIDRLAITHLDRLPRLPRQICSGYQIDTSEFDECFDFEAGRIVRIRPPRSAHPLAMSRITAAMARCTPCYSPSPTLDRDSFLWSLEKEVGVKVGVRSHGPTANEKYMEL